MHQFVNELKEGLRRCVVRSERVLIAVSGGADSVALLRGMIPLANEFAIELSVAHLNHRLRGSESDADAVWVQGLASSLQLSCEIGCLSSAQLSSDNSGLEERARELRYQFLDDAARKLNCSAIALAHTADDQVETVLHHLFRGTGMSGLRGMLASRQSAGGRRMIRPMLTIRRPLLEDYLSELGQPFRTDATNRDMGMTRNRIRRLILPLLREQINPQVDAAILRLAEQASEMEEFLRLSADQVLARCVKEAQPGICHLDARELNGQSRHLVREVFRAIWQRQQWPLQSMGFADWNRLAEVLLTRETITLPNRIEARFHSDWLLVLRCL